MEMINGNFSVLMFPWLGHGHIYPYLELAKRLAERNLIIYICSTPANLKSVKSISKTQSLSIQFVELHLPSLPELPSHYHTTKGLPPYLMPTLKTAFDMAAPEFSNILATLNPNLIIYDFLQPWAPALAHAHSIPAVEFLSLSAAMFGFSLHWGKNPDMKFPFQAIYLHDHEVPNFKIVMSSDIDKVNQCQEISDKIILLRTFREIEDKYIDYATSLLGKKIVPVGPLVSNSIKEEEEENKEITEFLNKKQRSSTVLVSFGTEFFLSKEDTVELAHGLELSNVNFIWAITFHAGDKSSLKDILPQGFLNRIRDRGIVYKGFVPQKTILNHESIGGFVTHCGWGSVMESMRFGVPIIAMAMHLDQPVNARLVQEVGVGVEVKRGRDGKVCREGVAKVIKEVVVERNGDLVRKRVKEMSEIMRCKGDEEIDGVVEELAQLCLKCN